MSAIASQLASLRKQHQSALASYDFQRADLVHQQIQTLQQQMSKDSLVADCTQAELEFEHHCEELAARSLDSDRRFADQSAEITARFAERKRGVGRVFEQEGDRLRAEHALAAEREASRAIPGVETLLFESRACAKQHNYAQARAAHEQALALRDSVAKERRRALDAALVRDLRKLREREERALAHIGQREKAALAAVARKRDAAAGVASQCMRVKDLKADRMRREAVRSERPRSALLSPLAPTPRRSHSIASDSLLPKRSWQIAMDAE
jgi:hypothetical protein